MMDDQKHKFKKDNLFFKIQLNTERKFFYMHAESESDMNDWITVIKAGIEAYKANETKQDVNVEIHDDDEAGDDLAEGTRASIFHTLLPELTCLPTAST
jgi:hypothetical protein